MNHANNKKLMQFKQMYTTSSDTWKRSRKQKKSQNIVQPNLCPCKPRRYLNEDPTAPHLKYGMFPKNAPKNPLPPPRLTSRSWNSTNRERNNDRNNRYEDDINRKPRQYSKMRETQKTEVFRTKIVRGKTQKKKPDIERTDDGQCIRIMPQTEGTNCDPQLVFRSLDKCLKRELVISPSTHFDIKPKKRYTVVGY